MKTAMYPKGNLFILFFLCFAITEVVAQSDSTNIQFLEESIEESDYKDGKKYDYFSRDLIEEKFQFRAAIENPTYTSAFIYPLSVLSIGAEYKLAKSYSILGKFIRAGDFDATGYEFAVRHYYNKKKKIEEGLSANNMNGGYVAIGYERLRNEFGDSYSRTNVLKAHWGVQQRLGKLGFFGFNLGFDYGWDENNFNPRSLQYLTFTNQARVGIAIGPKTDRSKELSQIALDHRITNPSAQLKDEKGLVKIGLENFSLGADFIGVSMRASYEHKLLTSLSVYGGLSGYFSRWSVVQIANPIDPNLDSISSLRNRGYDFHVGVKHYYAMDKKIEQNLSGNNLSGNYIGFEVNQLFGRQISAGLLDRSTRPSYRLFWGAQRRMGNRGYVELNTGLQNYAFGPFFFVDDFQRTTQLFLKLNFGLGF
ncbi:MAG: hypothetical protein AAFX87_19820 [Bacteroidota bacterium]